MTQSLMTWAPFIGAAVVIIVFLALRLYGEAMKYVADMQFYLNQKIIAYNKANAALSVLKSRMAKLEKRSNELLIENARLRKSLEIMNQFVEEQGVIPQKAPQSKTQVVEETRDPEKVAAMEKEITSIHKLLNGDLKEQLKNYSREIEWLSKRLNEIHTELKTSKKKPTSLHDLTYYRKSA